jgi:hypothetical protein
VEVEVLEELELRALVLEEVEEINFVEEVRVL